MKLKTFSPIVFTILIAPIASARPSQTQYFTLNEVVSKGLATSAKVHAANERTSAARHTLDRERAGFAPVVELGPGIGFTNGNSILTQRIDIGGVVAAQGKVAKAEYLKSLADLQFERQTVAYEVASIYYAAVRSKTELKGIVDSLAISKQFADLLQKKVELGSAPQVQATRASIEASRIEQEAIKLRGDLDGEVAALRTVTRDDTISAALIPDQFPKSSLTASEKELLATAEKNRSDLASIQFNVEIGRADVDLIRAQRKPILSGNIVTDFWSLDRKPFQSRNVGFQALLSFPLANKQSSANEKRAKSLAMASELDLAALKNSIERELAQISASLKSKREVAGNYETIIVPKSLGLVKVSKAGFDEGLITLMELLDAQRTARQTQSEYVEALFQVAKAELDMSRTVGILSPPTAATTEAGS